MRAATARHDDAAAAWGKILALLVGLAALQLLGGCGVQGASVGPGTVDSPSPATALKAAYELEGQNRDVVFLEASDLDGDELAQLMAELSAALGVEVLPAEAAVRSDPDLPALTPLDPDTGRIGVSLTLWEITETEPGRYEAVVSYARSGLDGGELVLYLEPGTAGWSVVDHTDGPQA